MHSMSTCCLQLQRTTTVNILYMSLLNLVKPIFELVCYTEVKISYLTEQIEMLYYLTPHLNGKGIVFYYYSRY